MSVSSLLGICRAHSRNPLIKTGPGKQEKIHSPACQFGTLLSMLIFTFKLGYWANTLSCHSLSTSW